MLLNTPHSFHVMVENNIAFCLSIDFDLYVYCTHISLDKIFLFYLFENTFSRNTFISLRIADIIIHIFHIPLLLYKSINS